MSASKAKANKERDAMRAQLSAMMSSSSAPGAEQAERAAKVQSEAKPPKTPRKSPVSKGNLKPNQAKVVKKSPAKKNLKGAAQTRQSVGGEEERAEKMSVSLHPTDQDNAELIEDALREAGLITRRAPISFLLKVALASFDSSKVKNLPEIVQAIRAKDGRGRWAQEMSRKVVK